MAKEKYCRFLTDSSQLSQNFMDDEFFVAQINYREGLSKLPYMVLDIYSGSKTRDYKELCDLLDKKVWVDIEQSDDENRMIVGNVSQVKHLGKYLVSQQNQTIYRYRVVVTSVLNNMKFVRHSRSYLGKNFQDVINDVLSYYQISTSFLLTSSDKQNFYTGSRNFYQRNESDYDFFKRLLLQAGWSFRLYTQEDKNGSSSEAILITDGNTFDQSGEDQIYDASINAEENDDKIKISDWSMEKRVVINSFTTDSSEFSTAQTADTTQSSGNGFPEKRKWFLNETGALFSAVDNDAKKDLEANRTDALDRYTKTGEECFTGAASALRIQLGCKLNLADFYGAGGSSVEARVTDLDIEVTDHMPDGYPGADRDAKITVNLQGISSQTEKVPLFTDSEKFVKNNASSEDSSNDSAAVTAIQSPLPDTKSNANIVFSAIVCDKDGNIHTVTTDAGTENETTTEITNSACVMESSDNTEGMFFYALLDGAANPSLIQYTMPLGGNGQGIYRLPRIGDRIAVMLTGNENRYILLSYLPTYDGYSFVSKNQVENTRKMTVIRHNAVGAVAGYIDASSTEYSPNPTQYSNLKYSEMGMYSENGKESIRIQTPGYRYDHAEKDYISTAQNFLFSTPVNKDGIFHVSKVRKINLQAEKEIRLHVGRAMIIISEKGIEMRSRQARFASGSQDTVVTLSPVGFGVTSPSIGLSGFKIGMENAFGDVFSLCGGTASLHAAKLVFSTSEKEHLYWAKVVAGVGIGLVGIPSILGLIYDSTINSRTYDSVVSDGTINSSGLYEMQSAPLFDYVGGYLYMLHGEIGTILAVLGGIEDMYYTCYKYGSDADNTSNTVGTAFSILDLVVNSVAVSLINTFVDDEEIRAFVDDSLYLILAVAKYIYILTRANKLEKEIKDNTDTGILIDHPMSYFRFDSKQMEFWTHKMIVDTDKTELYAYDLPDRKKKARTEAGQKSLKERLDKSVNNIMNLTGKDKLGKSDSKKLASSMANLHKVEEEAKDIARGTYEQCRKDAPVKLILTREDTASKLATIALTSEKLCASSEKEMGFDLGPANGEKPFTLSADKNGITIKAKALSSTIDSVNQTIKTLTSDITQGSISGSQMVLGSKMMDINGNLVQFGNSSSSAKSEKKSSSMDDYNEWFKKYST